MVEDSFDWNTVCTACRLRDRPGKPAVFVDDDPNEWICNACVIAGEDHIRRMFAEQAERFSRVAKAYEEASREEVEIDEREVRRVKEELDRWHEEVEAARLRGDFDSIPF